MSIDQDPIRDEIRAFIADHWSLDRTLRDWWRSLAESGFAAPNLPEPYGRSLSSTGVRLIADEMSRAGVIAPPRGAVAVPMAIPTLLAHATASQCERFIPAILRGEHSWCQLFSEPGAGSDLASVGARAIKDGMTWVVNGQKVWNSQADIAEFGLLLARTNVDVPKHSGITYFVLAMGQPGVEVRPLRQMNGEAHFCEVFLTDAIVPDEYRIDEPGRGWAVAQVTLANERRSIGEGPARGMTTVRSGEKAGNLDTAVGVLLSRGDRNAGEFSKSAIPPKKLIALAKERGVDTDALIRDRLVRYHIEVSVNRWTQQRMRVQALNGTPVRGGPSLAKLATSNICRTSRDTAFAVAGTYSMITGADAPMHGELHTTSLASFGASLGGGTDEVQRNLVAEKGLGLPREPSADKDIPFKESMARGSNTDA